MNPQNKLFWRIKMGATYGTNFLDTSFQSFTDEFVNLPTEEQLNIYTRLFNLCSKKDSIRAIVNDELYQWTYKKKVKSYICDEYNGRLRREILEYNESISGNGAPYSYFDGLEGCNIMLPGENIITDTFDLKKDLNLDIDDEVYMDRNVCSITEFVNLVKDMHMELEKDREAFSDDEDFDNILEFQKSLIIEAVKCREYKLLFILP